MFFFGWFLFESIYFWGAGKSDSLLLHIFGNVKIEELKMLMHVSINSTTIHFYAGPMADSNPCTQDYILYGANALLTMALITE